MSYSFFRILKSPGVIGAALGVAVGAAFWTVFFSKRRSVSDFRAALGKLVAQPYDAEPNRRAWLLYDRAVAAPGESALTVVLAIQARGNVAVIYDDLFDQKSASDVLVVDEFTPQQMTSMQRQGMTVTGVLPPLASTT